MYWQSLYAWVWTSMPLSHYLGRLQCLRSLCSSHIWLSSRLSELTLFFPRFSKAFSYGIFSQNPQNPSPPALSVAWEGSFFPTEWTSYHPRSIYKPVVWPYSLPTLGSLFHWSRRCRLQQIASLLVVSFPHRKDISSSTPFSWAGLTYNWCTPATFS